MRDDPARASQLQVELSGVGDNVDEEDSDRPLFLSSLVDSDLHGDTWERCLGRVSRVLRLDLPANGWCLTPIYPFLAFFLSLCGCSVSLPNICTYL